VILKRGNPAKSRLRFAGCATESFDEIGKASGRNWAPGPVPGVGRKRKALHPQIRESYAGTGHLGLNVAAASGSPPKRIGRVFSSTSTSKNRVVRGSARGDAAEQTEVLPQGRDDILGVFVMQSFSSRQLYCLQTLLLLVWQDCVTYHSARYDNRQNSYAESAREWRRKGFRRLRAESVNREDPSVERCSHPRGLAGRSSAGSTPDRPCSCCSSQRGAQLKQGPRSRRANSKGMYCQFSKQIACVAMTRMSRRADWTSARLRESWSGQRRVRW